MGNPRGTHQSVRICVTARRRTRTLDVVPHIVVRVVDFALLPISLGPQHRASNPRSSMKCLRISRMTLASQLTQIRPSPSGSSATFIASASSRPGVERFSRCSHVTWKGAAHESSCSRRVVHLGVDLGALVGGSASRSVQIAWRGGPRHPYEVPSASGHRCRSIKVPPAEPTG